MITTLHRGYSQMITVLHRGGGSLGTPKNDYVICVRPLMVNTILNFHIDYWHPSLSLIAASLKTKTCIEFIM